MPTASKTAHTPGPWHVEDRMATIAVVDDGDFPLAEVYGQSAFGRERCEANARLIAAAPALLDACEAAERLLAVAAHVGDTEAHCLEVTWDDAERVVAAARAAIAAAKGEAT